MSEENVAIMRAAFDAFNRGGIEAALEYFAPEVEVIRPEWIEGGLFRGHDGIRRIASTWTEHFDEFSVPLESVIDAGGDHVVALFTQRGRIRGTGSWIEQPIGWDCQVHDSKIVHVHAYLSWEEALKAAALDE